MAGGALGGVAGAALRLLPRYSESAIKSPFYDHAALGQVVSVVLFTGLCLYLWLGSTRRRPAGEPS
jgi:hypothetical protein